ncbi:MAG: TldD/PmbA family protein [Polyangiaceae bacterium]
MSELLEIAKNAAALALKVGATEASASAYKTREVELTWRDGKVEKTSEATTRGLSVALYVDGKYSAVSTSDLRPDAVSKFLEETLAMTKTLARDPFRSLPDPKLYEGRAKLDLQLADPAYDSLTAEQRLAWAKELEEGARSAKFGEFGADSLVSVSAYVSDSFTERARVTTNGFEGQAAGTAYWLYAGVTAKDPDGRRPEGSAGGGARHLTDLASAGGFGREATERAFGCIGAKKAPSQVVPVVVENRVVGRLFGALARGLSGRALQQKQSFLEGKLDTQITAPLLDVRDDPHIKKGFGSRLYDGEGFASKPFPVIDKGVLKTFYIDDYYGRKLGMAPTTAGSSNLVFGVGKKGAAALIADVGNGILITGFLGGNSNPTTGDFSFGIQGFLIENGKQTAPISEMNVSGNLLELWSHLSALGSDPYPYTSVLTPTMVFDGVQVAGA